MAPRVMNDSNGGVSEGTFFHHVRELEDLKRQASSIAGKIAKQKKLAKDDGLFIKDLEAVLAERAMSIEEQIESHNRRVAYRRFMKMPAGMQMNILDEIKDEIGLSDEERQKKWEDDGYIAGKLGQNRDVCPHEDPNSLGARFWMIGYDRGQGELAKGIKKKAPEPEKPAADTKADEKVKPKDEPEVAAAKAKGKGAGKAKGGVTYWHNAEMKKVFEVGPADADAPEGSENVTKPQFEKLKAEYEAAEKAEWEAAEKAKQPADEKGGDADDFGDDDGEPPSPKTA